MKLTRDILQRLLGTIAGTRSHEIGCDDCFEQLDRYAEMTLAGLPPDAAMPLVKQHLDRCRDCREEFEALLDALRLLGPCNDAPR